GIVADMFDVCPVLTEAFSSGGTVSKVEKNPVTVESNESRASGLRLHVPKEEEKTVEEAPVKAEPKKEAAPAPKEASPVAPVTPAPVTPAPVTSAPVTPATPAAVPAGGIVAAFDPSLLHGLELQIATLHTELANVKAELKVKNDISALKSDITKAINDAQKTTKTDIDRMEKNARSFQDGGLKRVDKIEDVVTTEVRKVREILRKGISNDTQDLREGINAIRSTAIAAVVINILVLFLLGLMMATH
ncbi:MAG: hypothetical protein CL916_11315, partial [Deltaproteobacteria bacterium]|nr:hypothetical protein [Deltaproteobacteria bacterium]